MDREINYNIDKTKFPQVASLSEAIETSDIQLAKESIEILIRKNVIVQLRFKYQLVVCDSHSYYFPNTYSKFQQSDVYFSINCQYQHKFCKECIIVYLKECFNHHYLNNTYPCICCSSWNVEGSLLLFDNDLLDYLILIYGQKFISEIANFPNNRKELVITNNCKICDKSNCQLYAICLKDHYSCQNCLQKWAQGKYEIHCFVNNCQESLNTIVILTALKESKVLINLKEKFREKGIFLNFCPKCQKVVKLEKLKRTTSCVCGTKICNNCERIGHPNSCFFDESKKEFEVIDLSPPCDIGNPKNLREQEYIKAKYAFENFVESFGSYSFKSARLIVNKALEKRYYKKMKKMANECGGYKNVGETYIWHGSKYKNYDLMMRDGLKVGGVDIPIANANVHGYGVYSSITPDTPMTYADDSQWILGCLAMKGNVSKKKIMDTNLLDKGNVHSYEVGNWKIFFTKEQILPRFLIEYS